MQKIGKQQIPWLMAGARTVMGPLMIAGQACGWNGLALAGIVVTALLSDIFDGVLARRWQCDTAAVRMFDSMADMVFYLGVGVALWMREPRMLRERAVLLGMVLSVEVARWALEFAKFGKPASYHSYLAKTWGLVMAVAVTMVFAGGHGWGVLTVSLVVGVASNIEGFVISVVLPVWRKDVKTLSAALRIRLAEYTKTLPAMQSAVALGKRESAPVAGALS